LDDLRLVFREVRLHGRRHSLLALALPGREHLSEFADVVLTYAQKLLALDLLKSRDSLLLQRKMQGDLLDELLQGADDPAAFGSRLAAFHLDPGRDLLVAVVDVVDLTPDLAARGIRGVEQVQEARHELQDAVERTLDEHRVPAITRARGDAVLLLVQPGRGPEVEPRPLGLAVKEAVEDALGWPRLAVGLSDPFQGLEGVPRALAQAREAVRLARTGRRGGVTLFGELGPSIRFLENQSLDQLALFYESTVKPLEVHDAGHGDELLPTLRTYLEERRSVSRAARRLFIHENTLRYRLKKIEALLDVDLDETEALVDLYLGLRSGTIILGRRSSSPGGPAEG
jgi:purine catabolism regulator